MDSQGTKRKRDHKLSDSSTESPLTTDMAIILNAKKIMKSVTDNLDHKIIMHKDIISKINKMNNVTKKKATIGIFGKSGEGKSSLLNAVLGKRDLLPSGCFGACTVIVTQVEANLTDSNYIAEIELISKEEWEQELKDLFTVFAEVRTSEDSEEDRNHDLFETAVEKITALYGEDSDKKTLEELKKDEKFAEIETFLSNSKKTISKSNVSEFANDVASYILQSQTSPGGWYWPLVKSVTIKVPDCQELLENIVLIDLPGTGDCNKIRDDLWKSKLKDCSSVWIVSDINRAITDKDPWGILKHCAEELGPGGECKSINFICTKTDDINPSAYIRSERLTTDHNSEEKDQKKTCILHRNGHAKTRVTEKFENSGIKKKICNVFLQTFTVSSNAFFDISLNMESIETEIPKLQDDLRTLNKNINRDLARDYVNEAKGVLSLIQSVQLDTDKKADEIKVSIRKIYLKNLTKALNQLDNGFDTIYRVLEQCLSNGVEDSVQSCVENTQAMIAPSKDRRGFHKTLQALCKNHGCFRPRKMEEELDLNEILVKPLKQSIDEEFNLIFPVSGITEKSAQGHINNFSILLNDSDCATVSMLSHIQYFIKVEETKLKASVNREIIDKKKDIYSSIKKTVQNEMTSCYDKAAKIHGKKSMEKRQELLKDTIDEIKQDMFNKAKMEVLKKVKSLKLYIKDYLESELKKSIEMSLSKNKVKITFRDISKQTEQLESLSKQLSD